MSAGSAPDHSYAEASSVNLKVCKTLLAQIVTHSTLLVSALLSTDTKSQISQSFEFKTNQVKCTAASAADHSYAKAKSAWLGSA